MGTQAGASPAPGPDDLLATGEGNVGQGNAALPATARISGVGLGIFYFLLF